MCFVWAPSASAFVCETEGDTQTLVRQTFDEEPAHKANHRLMKFMMLFHLLLQPTYSHAFARTFFFFLFLSKAILSFFFLT